MGSERNRGRAANTSESTASIVMLDRMQELLSEHELLLGGKEVMQVAADEVFFLFFLFFLFTMTLCG